MEWTGGPEWIVGVQWHPERMRPGTGDRAQAILGHATRPFRKWPGSRYWRCTRRSAFSKIGSGGRAAKGGAQRLKKSRSKRQSPQLQTRFAVKVRESSGCPTLGRLRVGPVFPRDPRAAWRKLEKWVPH